MPFRSLTWGLRRDWLPVSDVGACDKFVPYVAQFVAPIDAVALSKPYCLSHKSCQSRIWFSYFSISHHDTVAVYCMILTAHVQLRSTRRHANSPTGPLVDSEVNSPPTAQTISLADESKHSWQIWRRSPEAPLQLRQQDVFETQDCRMYSVEDWTVAWILLHVVVDYPCASCCNSL